MPIDQTLGPRYPEEARHTCMSNEIGIALNLK